MTRFNPLRVSLIWGLLVWGVLCCSCTPSGRAIGVWEGDRNLPVPPGEDPSIGKTLSWVKLEILPNSRFTLLDFGMPKEGRYYEQGDSIKLVVDMVMNRRIENNSDLQATHRKPLELQLSGQSATFFDPNNSSAGKITLKRESQLKS